MRGRGNLVALESFRGYPQCLHCGIIFVNLLELFDHLKEFPHHKSENSDVSMVTLQTSYWVQKIKDGLDVDQQKLIELFLQGNHILLIGGAGCGKTHVTKCLMRLIYAMFGDEWCKNHLAGVAMTNPIANNMNLLSFEGILKNKKYIYFFHFYFKLIKTFHLKKTSFHLFQLRRFSASWELVTVKMKKLAQILWRSFIET